MYTCSQMRWGDSYLIDITESYLSDIQFCRWLNFRIFAHVGNRELYFKLTFTLPFYSI